MYLKLVPLHIPSGWAVVHNAFGDEDPLVRNGWIANTHFYNENLLLIQPIKFEKTSATLDTKGYTFKLGWYPHGNPHGSYQFSLWKQDFTGPVVHYESRTRDIIRQVIQGCFQLIGREIEPEKFQTEFDNTARKFDKSQRSSLGVRKQIFKESSDKKNRLTYSQVGAYSPVYYEVSNVVYLEPKSNKVIYNMLEAENKKG